MGSSLKIDFSLISIIVSIGRKKPQNKAILFPADKKIVSNNRIEGLTEKFVPVEGKTVSTGEKMEENGFN